MKTYNIILLALVCSIISAQMIITFNRTQDGDTTRGRRIREVAEKLCERTEYIKNVDMYMLNDAKDKKKFIALVSCKEIGLPIHPSNQIYFGPQLDNKN